MLTNRLDSAKIFLNALGESLHERLDGMSDEELRDIFDGCGELTRTNCWWLAYQLAPAVRSAIEATLRTREYRASRTAPDSSHD